MTHTPQHQPQPQPAYQQTYPQQVRRPLKDTSVAYLCMLATLLGVAGIQHFYLGKPGRGVLWLLTWGLLGVGTLIDVFTLPSQVRVVNAQIVSGVR